MEQRTLLLNAWGGPHAVLSWEEAICLVYQGKVIVLEEYEETVSSPSITYAIPAVLQLKVTFKPHKKGVRFSRLNIFTRDKFCCQYCGRLGVTKDLNYDHVIPRQQGGRTTWDNIVASCYPCNQRKAARTPEQAGMRLRSVPRKPDKLPLAFPTVTLREVPDIWKPYMREDADQKQSA